jgi:predicted PurR-regulated permease PerM
MSKSERAVPLTSLEARSYGDSLEEGRAAMSRDTVLMDAGVERLIRIGALLLLLTACFLVVEPFIPIVAWAAVMAVALYPAYSKLREWMNGRGKTAATVLMLGLLIAFLAPVIALSETLIGGIREVSTGLQTGSLVIPMPRESVQGWPLIGERVAKYWTLAATNLEQLVAENQVFLADLGRKLLGQVAGIGLGVLQFVVSMIVAGFFLATGETSAATMVRLGRRVAGDTGELFVGLATSTTRSVGKGVLGVAIIQSLLAGLAMLVAGVPGAGLWSIVALILCVIQLGPGLVLIPAVIYVFAQNDTVTGVVFLIFSLFVMMIDNVLKPLLLGRGVDVPMLVVVIGAIGGLLAMGVIGLFVGAIVLVLGYSSLVVWLDADRAAAATAA